MLQKMIRISQTIYKRMVRNVGNSQIESDAALGYFYLFSAKVKNDSFYFKLIKPTQTSIGHTCPQSCSVFFIIIKAC